MSKNAECSKTAILQTGHSAFSNFFGDIFKNNLKKLILFKNTELAQESKNNKILRSPGRAFQVAIFLQDQAIKRKEMGLTNKYRQAELDSASTLYTVHRFRNEFGMTLRNELFGQQPKYSKLNQIIFL